MKDEKPVELDFPAYCLNNYSVIGNPWDFFKNLIERKAHGN